MAEATNPALLMTTPDGVKVYNGGFGLAIAADPTDPAKILPATGKVDDNRIYFAKIKL